MCTVRKLLETGTSVNRMELTNWHSCIESVSARAANTGCTQSAAQSVTSFNLKVIARRPCPQATFPQSHPADLEFPLKGAICSPFGCLKCISMRRPQLHLGRPLFFKNFWDKTLASRHNKPLARR